MAVIKKQRNSELPAISTASLPDVVFMILFFFMVSTSMKETDLKVQFTLPTASEIQKIENKSLTSYIYIGQPTAPMRATFGTAPRIQLNDSYRTTLEIRDFIASERDNLREADRTKMTVALKADRSTRMGIVTEVKQELRKADALRISYAANQGLPNQ